MDLVLGEDKEFADLLAQMAQEGGHQTDTERNDTVNPTFPTIPVTPLDTDAAANLTLAGTTAKSAPIITVTAPVQSAATAAALTATVVVHSGGKPNKVEAAAPPTFSRVDVALTLKTGLSM